jgi:uncharacterized membrane protein
MSDLNVFLFVTNICVVLLCGALLPVLPLLTRKSFLFGVKVPPEAQSTGEARALKRKYITITAIGGVAILAVSIYQYITAPDYTIYAVIFFPFVLIAIMLAAFVPNHSKALELKSRLGWNVAEITYADTKTSFTRGNLSAMPLFWYIISLIVIFVSLVIIAVQYPSLPEMIPIHWDINMEPDGWSPKSLGTMLTLPLVNLSMLVFIWLVGALIERAKLQIDHKEPAKSFAQHKKYRRLMGHGIGFLAFGLAALFFGLGLQTVFVGFTIPLGLIMLISVGPCIPACVIALRAGQGGTLLKVDATEVAAAESSDVAGYNAMSDDKHWAWGLFYHNPDDPAYFVGDRFGTNIGFNYSRLPVKIGVSIGVIALVACYVWMIMLFRTLI